MNLLEHEKETLIIKLITHWPRTIQLSVEHKEPHRIVYYLQNLASELHSYWSLGKGKNGVKILSIENKNLTMARLSLLEGVRVVIGLGLNIIGIEPVEKM